MDGALDSPWRRLWHRLKNQPSDFQSRKQSAPDLIWVDQVQFLDADAIAKFRTLSAPVVNYTIDDPFGGRDGRRFDNYLRAVPFYDLLAVVREENVAEARARGARNVLRIWRSADEVAHRPRVVTDEDHQKWGSEVSALATWFPERGPFMAELVRAGLPLSIWGNRWQKAPEWPELAPIGADQAKKIPKSTHGSSNAPKSRWDC